jgi:hypothetical protein
MKVAKNQMASVANEQQWISDGIEKKIGNNTPRQAT